jgi:hypothetical protein
MDQLCDTETGRWPIGSFQFQRRSVFDTHAKRRRSQEAIFGWFGNCKHGRKTQPHISPRQ